MNCRGGSKALEGYVEFLYKTELCLGRTLDQKEVDFLSWLYDRHLEEQQVNDTLEIAAHEL